MDRSNAAHTIMYLQKAVAIVPTTGAEWDAVRQVLNVIEAVANGRATVEVKPVAVNGKGADDNLHQGAPG